MYGLIAISGGANAARSSSSRSPSAMYTGRPCPPRGRRRRAGDPSGRASRGSRHSSLPSARGADAAPSRPRSGRRRRPPPRPRRAHDVAVRPDRAQRQLFDEERHAPALSPRVARAPLWRVLALVERAPEDRVQEVAERNEDRDDDRRLDDLTREREVAREQHHDHEHDRREDRAAPERPAPRRRLRPCGLRGQAGAGPDAPCASGRRQARARCPRRPPRRTRAAAPSPDDVSACAMAWRDYARLLQAISPPCTTVCTTGPPRWYAR